ncbi:MAG TPA: hypothetical protein VG406_04065 [Isosphaeraceae bacterium]|jgi:hypothetical protein|nr:hypothetical protein [Isosphaeraceae bacterium]
MPVTTPPRRPVENWEARRDEWIADVTRIVDDVEAWASEQDWLVHRHPKTLTDDSIGSYEVPMLMIRTPNAPLVLDPLARDVVGASGRIDLSVLQSLDNILIIKNEAGWHLVVDPPNLDRPWSKEGFLELAAGLAKRA